MAVTADKNNQAFPSPSEEILERNTKIVRQHLYEQMHASLKIGSELIDEEMKGAAIFIRPIVKAFYQNLVKKDLEHGTKKSINGMLKMARQMINDNVTEGTEEFYRRIEEKFPAYLKNDQTGRQCKKNHKNFPILAKNLKKTFEYQIRGILPLLRVTDEVNNYPELCRKAFPTAEECKLVLKKQIDHMRFGLNVIKEDLSILDIPTARDLIYRVLRKGFDRKVKDFFDDIDRIYGLKQ